MDFKSALSNAGVETDAAILADGILHRFHVSGDRPGSKNGWYILYGDDPAAGQFGCFKRGITQKWLAKAYHTLNDDEKALHKEKMETVRKQRDDELSRLQADCRSWCAERWKRSQDATNNHPYLVKKGVHAYGLKVMRDTLLIPLYNSSGIIQGMQFIQPDGNKTFKTGTAKQRSYFAIGKPKNNTLLICEGYATGASLHEATGQAVAVAFDAGNLKPVAEALRAAYPDLRLIICADNDQWGEKNIGIINATEAAFAVGGWLVIANFRNTASKPTDFNDLHQLEGLEEVRRQVMAAKPELIKRTEILPEPEQNSCTTVAPDIYSVMSRAGDLKALDVKIEYLVEGLIPEGMITVMYARSGMGKSTLMTQLCHAVSTGRPFMGLQVRQRECVYLDYENGLAVIVERLKKVQADDHAPFHIWHPGSEPPPPPLDKKEFASLAAIRTGSLVIVDTLKACNDADENKATEMKPIFDKLKLLRRQGLTIIALHHTAKGDDGKFRGSSVIQDQADHCLVMHKVKQPGSDAELDDDDDVSTYRLGTKFKTRARPFKMFLEFDKGTELFKGTDDPATDTMRQLQAIITNLNLSGEPTQTMILEAVKKDDSLEHLGRDAVRSLLKKGDGIFWQAERRPAMKNALVYLPISAYEHSAPFIEPEYSNTAALLHDNGRKQEKANSLQLGINTEFASFRDTLPEYSNSDNVHYVPLPVDNDWLELPEDDLKAAGWL